MGLIRDIGALAPDVKTAAEEGIAILKAQGIRHFVNETLRTALTQQAYYAQGREALELVNQRRADAGLWAITEEENRRTVTNAVHSLHQDGRCLDICPADRNGNPWWKAPQAEWEKIATVMKAVGFEWGGDWGRKRANEMGWDAPHYQIRAAS